MNRHIFLKFGLLSLAITLLPLGVSGCKNGPDNDSGKTKQEKSDTEQQKKDDNKDKEQKKDDTDSDGNSDDANSDDGNSDQDTPVKCHNIDECKADELCIGEECKVNENAVCHSDADCRSKYVCLNDGICQGGVCNNTNKTAGTACDDNDPCTVNDQCNEAGNCQGQVMDCNNPPPANCDENNEKYLTPEALGTCKVDETTGEGKCQYDVKSNDCQGDCAKNCASKCAGVSCEQDADSCWVVVCNDQLSGEGADLCELSTTKKAAGSVCKDASTNGKICNEFGACVECLDENQCGVDQECYVGKCVDKEPECTVTACDKATGILTVCNNKKITITTNCLLGCNDKGDDCKSKECEADSCSNGAFTKCENFLKQPAESCEFGCNTAASACACNGGQGRCEPSNYDSGAKPHDAMLIDYCNPFTLALDSYIKCPSVTNDRKNCEYYCGTQWAEASGTTITGYGRIVKSITNENGNLYCTDDLQKPISSWAHSTSRAVSDFNDTDVVEYKMEIANLKADTKYYCIYISEYTYTTDTGSKVFYNVCSFHNHNDDHTLPQGTLLEPNTVITEVMTKSVTTGN